MEEDLDELLKIRVERYFKRLVGKYKRRMRIANDKEYAHNVYSKWAGAHTMLRKEVNTQYQNFLETMEEVYKIGDPISKGVKVVRRELLYQKGAYNTITINDVQTNTGEGRFSQNLDNKTDLQLVYMFADHKAKDKFLGYLGEQLYTLCEETEGANTPLELPLEERLKPTVATNTKEFTTARQVLAFHFILEYFKVKNIDKTKIANFLQFMTGKNYDNIYKKVRNPYNLNDKYLKEDLRFVRAYFEDLGLEEITKLINNEINAI